MRTLRPIGNIKLTAAALAVGLAALLITMAAGCRKPKQTVPLSPPSVTVAHPVQEHVADFLDLTGTVAPSRSVDLVARVSGYLQSASFEEGSYVEKDQLLFVIEPETYEQQLRLAQAALLRAQSEYARQVELSKENATSTASVERWLSERDQASAQVELARLNLSYTRVLAPFAGRIGRRLVDPGNLVGPSVNTKLATLDQLAPIYLNFNLNEREALRIREYMRERGIAGFKPQQSQVPVLAGLQNQEGYPLTGHLQFVDSGVNPASGTIQMRAQFENEERVLLPGFFARVRIPLSERQPMLVVPGSAIGNDQEGDYVMVLAEGDLATRRSVIKGPLLPTGCAIRKGLVPTDRVVINGIMRARPGAKVVPLQTTVQPQPAPKTL